MLTYRIADCRYINDLSGKGAALYGGRWNSIDTYIVYTAQTHALALLETIVHIGRIPDNGCCMISIDIPDNSIQTYDSKLLPADWYKSPAPDHLKIIGDKFVEAGEYLVLKVPSAVMPEEHNYLINPRHKDFKKIKIVGGRDLNIDGRLLHH